MGPRWARETLFINPRPRLRPLNPAMSRIVLDAVGGDHAPTQAVAGVALALKHGYLKADEVVLTGPQQQVHDAVQAAGLPSDIEIVDAPDLLTSADSPTDAMRKKSRNSIAVGIQLVKEGKAGGFVSAGSTGTVVAAAYVSESAIVCNSTRSSRGYMAVEVSIEQLDEDFTHLGYI